MIFRLKILSCFTLIASIQTFASHKTALVTLDEYCKENKSLCVEVSIPSTWNEPYKTWVARLKDATILENGVVLDNKDRFISETLRPNVAESFSPEIAQTLQKKDRSPKENTVLHLNKRVAILTSYGQDNYYHWMVQILPRIHLLEESNISYDYFVLHPLTQKFQEESLNLLSVGRNKIHFLNYGTAFKADEVIVTNIPYVTYKTWQTFPSWVSSFWKKKIYAGIKCKEENYPESIFISREKAKTRKVVNEDELLSKTKFKKIHLEGLNIVEQACYFRNAKLIASPHGAGLTNLLFVEKKGTLLELFESTQDKSMYENMAKVLGFQYRSFISQEKIPDYGIVVPPKFLSDLEAISKTDPGKKID